MYKTKNIKFPCVIYDGTNGLRVINMVRKYCKDRSGDIFLVDENGTLYNIRYGAAGGDTLEIKKCCNNICYFVIDEELYALSSKYGNMFFEECE